MLEESTVQAAMKKAQLCGGINSLEMAMRMSMTIRIFGRMPSAINDENVELVGNVQSDQ
jgi:hypothetical protein